MRFMARWVISAIAVGVASYILPGVHLDGAFAALVAALVLGFFNGILRPILFILTLPLTILTLGLFYIVLNALMVLLTAAVVPGFDVAGFWWAILFSMILALANLVFGEIAEPAPRRVHWRTYTTHQRPRPEDDSDVIDVEVVEK